MTPNHKARLEAIEEDMREQATGSQDGYLLELANRLKEILKEVDDQLEWENSPEGRWSAMAAS